MGKRRKVQCESCGNIFNNDFQKKHENALHGGKRVKVKVPGAPANPFVASVNSELEFKTNVLVEKNDLSTVASVSMDDVSLDVSNGQHTHLLENVNSELEFKTNVLVEKNDLSTVASVSMDDVSLDISNVQHNIHLLENALPSNTTDSETNNLTDSVLNCAGQFKYLFDYIKLCKPIIHNFQEAEVLNTYKIVVEIKEAIDNIIKISNSVLEKCNDVTAQLESQSGNLSEVEVIDSVVEHDPGKRTKIISDDQRQYLIMLGPHQPMLNVHPRTEKYSFKYSWFEEFPHLEYSIIKDAAFCYVCSLFPCGAGREKSENNWTVKGVKNWKKIKGNGKNNVGKLKKYFSSESHKAALYEFRIL
eukprot:XP_016656891.1 PREDICTED: uncharacterized protein LOC107882686 [Acyrthosiphon pisum]